MIFSYRKWLARLRFVLLFSALTFALYQVMIFVHGWMEPVNKYKPPTGRSVKVFQQHQHASITDMREDLDASMGDRLRLFYWYGE